VRDRSPSAVSTFELCPIFPLHSDREAGTSSPQLLSRDARHPHTVKFHCFSLPLDFLCPSPTEAQVVFPFQKRGRLSSQSSFHPHKFCFFSIRRRGYPPPFSPKEALLPTAFPLLREGGAFQPSKKVRKNGSCKNPSVPRFFFGSRSPLSSLAITSRSSSLSFMKAAGYFVMSLLHSYHAIFPSSVADGRF